MSAVRKQENMVIQQRSLTFLELANLYLLATGKSAWEQKNGTLMAWAESQTNRFYINDDGVHLLVTK